MNAGTLSDRKGLFAPNVKLNIPFLSDADKKDLDYAISVNAELIAASFVQDGNCMREIRSYLKKHGANDIALIAKIESQLGINNIDDIISASEGIMSRAATSAWNCPMKNCPRCRNCSSERAARRAVLQLRRRKCSKA